MVSAGGGHSQASTLIRGSVFQLIRLPVWRLHQDEDGLSQHVSSSPVVSSVCVIRLMWSETHFLVCPENITSVRSGTAVQSDEGTTRQLVLFFGPSTLSESRLYDVGLW